MNIRRIMIIFGSKLSVGVIPVVIPTVPIADIHSNKMSLKFISGWQIAMVMDETKIQLRLIITIDTAFLTVSGVNLFEKTSISLEFFSVDTAQRNKTAMVTVFVPPAVEPDDPPMNIRIYVMTLDTGDKSAFGILLNPAVLVVVLAKKAFNIF